MKLIFCTESGCRDIVALGRDTRHCKCGKSGGKYEEDGLHATIWGPCIPFGFDNGSFLAALKHRPKSGLGSRFTSFIIPHTCPTVTVVEAESCVSSSPEPVDT